MKQNITCWLVSRAAVITTIDSVSAKQCVAHADAAWLVIVQDECSPALSHSSAKGNYFVLDAAGPLITTGSLLLIKQLPRHWPSVLGAVASYLINHHNQHN